MSDLISGYNNGFPVFKKHGYMCRQTYDWVHEGHRKFRALMKDGTIENYIIDFVPEEMDDFLLADEDEHDYGGVDFEDVCSIIPID